MAAPKLARFSREDFVRRVWEHKAGEHTTIIGPTGSGKSTLGYLLFNRSITAKLPGVAVLTKPRDHATQKAASSGRLRTVRTWPPRRSLFEPKPPRGHVLHPRFTYDQDLDLAEHAAQIRAVLADAYRNGDRIVYMPDLYGVLRLMPELARPVEIMWINARSNGASMWTDSQKATHIPLLAFNQATHLLLFRDPDKRGRERFGEISGMDPKLVEQANLSLGRHEALYVRQTDGTMCIVEA